MSVPAFASDEPASAAAIRRAAPAADEKRLRMNGFSSLGPSRATTVSLAGRSGGGGAIARTNLAPESDRAAHGQAPAGTTGAIFPLPRK
jgi:hypothetical protein